MWPDTAQYSRRPSPVIAIMTVLVIPLMMLGFSNPRPWGWMGTCVMGSPPSPQPTIPYGTDLAGMLSDPLQVLHLPDSSTVTLRAVIDSGIRMLTAKEHRRFIERFIDPGHLASIQEDEPLDDLVKMFREEKATLLLKALKEIRKKKPKYEDDGNRAVFQLRTPRKGPDEVRFTRVDGLWYLMN